MSRSNLQIYTGSYVGNGADNRNIIDAGFMPELVIIKNGANNSVVRTRFMQGDTSGFLTSTNANLADRIQNLQALGFQIGTSAQVNANAANCYYIAIRGSSAQSYFRPFRYYGDGTDNRDFTTGGLGFTPDIVLVRGNAVVNSIFRTSAMPADSTGRFDANTQSADMIQLLESGGFQLGANASANGSGTEFHGAALKTLSGAIQVGSYFGNGSGLSIAGVGFKPDAVIIKGHIAQQARLYTKEMVTNGDNSLFMGTTASDATGILSLDSDGFTVGASASVSSSGIAYYWIALKAGNFNAPLTRTAA